MITTLNDLAVGDRGRIAGYGEGGRAYRKKLLSMGLTPGVELEVVRVAPMGDPLEVRARGTSVSLRKGEAAALQVEKRS
jgi:ferrous iron transport protein A